MKRIMGNESFDVRSVMDILYGGGSDDTSGKFVCASDGKPATREGEVVRNSENTKDYSSFWRKK